MGFVTKTSALGCSGIGPGGGVSIYIYIYIYICTKNRNGWSELIRIHFLKSDSQAWRVVVASARQRLFFLISSFAGITESLPVSMLHIYIFLFWCILRKWCHGNMIHWQTEVRKQSRSTKFFHKPKAHLETWTVSEFSLFSPSSFLVTLTFRSINTPQKNNEEKSPGSPTWIYGWVFCSTILLFLSGLHYGDKLSLLTIGRLGDDCHDLGKRWQWTWTFGRCIPYWKWWDFHCHVSLPECFFPLNNPSNNQMQNWEFAPEKGLRVFFIKVAKRRNLEILSPTKG